MDDVSYRIVGENGLHKKERNCPVIGYLDGIYPDKDLVAFGRWRNTGEAFLVFRTNNTRLMKRTIVLTEEKLKEIMAWYKKKKKEPSELKKLIKKKKRS